MRDAAKRSGTRLNLMLTSLEMRSVLLGLFENVSFDRFAGNTCNLNNETRRRLHTYIGFSPLAYVGSSSKDNHMIIGL